MSIVPSLNKIVSGVVLGLDGTLLNTDGLVAEVLKVSLVKYGKQWDGREALNISGRTPLKVANAIVKDYGHPCAPEEFISGINPIFIDKFLEAANQLKIEPSSCLVIEDSLPGVMAGKAAGMQVVAMPSIPKQSHLHTSADEIINSLLDLKPENWGLPPFQDWVEGTLPIEPWRMGGPVIKGFGRGSKLLGIPTANLSTEGYSDLLSEHPSGVYFGWAGLSRRGIYKMAMNIGWSPYFNNQEKTIEPWLLHKFDEDFYGEELRLVIVGHIRPEIVDETSAAHGADPVSCHGRPVGVPRSGHEKSCH